MSDREINLAFIGTGAWAQSRHLPALDLMRNRTDADYRVRLRGICSLNLDEAQQMAKRYGFEKVYRDAIQLQCDCVDDWIEAGYHESEVFCGTNFDRDGNPVANIRRRSGPIQIFDRTRTPFGNGSHLGEFDYVDLAAVSGDLNCSNNPQMMLFPNWPSVADSEKRPGYPEDAEIWITSESGDIRIAKLEG